MSSKRAHRRRACRGKVRYKTNADARVVINNMANRGVKRGPLDVYRCVRCGGWHFGHPAGAIQRMIAESK